MAEDESEGSESSAGESAPRRFAYRLFDYKVTKAIKTGSKDGSLLVMTHFQELDQHPNLAPGCG